MTPSPVPPASPSPEAPSERAYEVAKEIRSCQDGHPNEAWPGWNVNIVAGIIDAYAARSTAALEAECAEKDRRIAELEAREWKAIETAPKHGWFLALAGDKFTSPRSCKIAVIHQVEGVGFGPWEGSEEAYYKADYFTHWMPLPDAALDAEILAAKAQVCELREALNEGDKFAAGWMPAHNSAVGQWLMRHKDLLAKTSADFAHLATVDKDRLAELEGEIRGWENMVDDLHSQVEELWPVTESMSGAIQDKINAAYARSESDRSALARQVEGLRTALEDCGADADRLDSCLLRLLKDEDCRGEANGLINLHAGAFARRQTALRTTAPVAGNPSTP